jgi:peptide-methionine (S)-S-oxide reductase
MAKAIRVLVAALAACFLYVAPSGAQTEDVKSAILAGGCFWCVQSDFDKLKGQGVIKTLAGYTGGTIENPTYENYHDVGKGVVPHVEAAKITYDPAKISYKKLLQYFVHHIDPLDGGGQFCDRGPSYRPVIFTSDQQEKAVAREVLQAAEKVLGKPVAVEILPASRFWPAEEYHQEYHEKNPLRYKFYRWNCGRDQRLEELWGK